MKNIIFRTALALALCIGGIAPGIVSNQAYADFIPPPPPPPPPPAPKPAPDTTDHGGHRGRFTAKSFLQIQGASVGCSAVVNIGDSVIKAHGRDPRELTPVGAIDNAAACGFVPAIIVKVINWATGVKDNVCSIRVARRALRENNSRRAREELLWNDGSWERRQAKFLDQYAACYRRH